MKNAFLSLFCLICCHVFGQESQRFLQPIISIGVPIGISTAAEFPVTTNSTLKLELGLLFGPGIRHSGGQNISIGLGLVPYADIVVRRYLQLREQGSSGQALYHNSGEYAFLQIEGYGSPVWQSDNYDNNSSLSIGLGMGMQRCYHNRFIFGIGGGLGYYIFDKRLGFVGDLTVGIILNYRRTK